MAWEQRARKLARDMIEWLRTTPASDSEIARRAGVSRGAIGISRRAAKEGEIVDIKISSLVGLAKARDELAKEERQWKKRLGKENAT